MSRIEEAILACAQEIRALKQSVDGLTDCINQAAGLWQFRSNRAPATQSGSPAPKTDESATLDAAPPENHPAESRDNGTHPSSIEPVAEPRPVEARQEMRSTSPRQQAIASGELVPYPLASHGKTHDICFTRELYDALKGYPLRLNWIGKRGLNLLAKSAPEDNDHYRRRVVIADEVWVIADWNGITFLRPEAA